MRKYVLFILIFFVAFLLVYFLLPTIKGQHNDNYIFKKINEGEWERVSRGCDGVKSTMCAPTSCVTKSNPLYSVCLHSGVIYEVNAGKVKEQLLCAADSNGGSFTLGKYGCSSVLIN